MKRHYLPLAMIYYRTILPLTIYIRHDIAEILLKLELNANQYIQTFKTFMTILYSWSATNYKTIGTCWVDHSLKGWRMEFIIETNLYRPQVKCFAMFEVVQHNLYSKHATKLMSELLGKTKKKGLYLWTEWFSVTVR